MFATELNRYQYAEKSAYVKTLDFILTPTRIALGCHTYTCNLENKTIEKTDAVAYSIFSKFLCGGLAFFILQLTAIVCYLKSLDGNTRVVSQLYKNQFSSSTSSNSKPLISPKHKETEQPQPEKDLDRKQFENYLEMASASETQKKFVESITDKDYNNLSILKKEVLNFYNEFVKMPIEKIDEKKELPIKTVHFTFKIKAPHILHIEWEPTHWQKWISFKIGGDMTIPMSRDAFGNFIKGILLDQKETLGTGESRSSEAMFVFIEGLQTDPFDAAHVNSSAGAGKDIYIYSKNNKKMKLTEKGLQDIPS